jgi:hypothetical protein
MNANYHRESGEKGRKSERERKREIQNERMCLCVSERERENGRMCVCR